MLGEIQNCCIFIDYREIQGWSMAYVQEFLFTCIYKHNVTLVSSLLLPCLTAHWINDGKFTPNRDIPRVWIYLTFVCICLPYKNFHTAFVTENRTDYNIKPGTMNVQPIVDFNSTVSIHSVRRCKCIQKRNVIRPKIGPRRKAGTSSSKDRSFCK